MAQSKLDELRANPVLIIASLVFCFPVGLVLVWLHPTWPKPKKWLWTGIVSGVVVLLMVVAAMQEAAIKKNLEEADQLWASGQKAEAVSKYKTVLDSGVSSVDKSLRPTVFQRVIEFEAEKGDTSSAMQYARQAASNDVEVVTDKPAAKKLLADAKAEALAKKNEERSGSGSATAGSSSGSKPGSKSYEANVESRTVKIELSPAVAAEIELSDLSYNKSDWRINLKLKLLRPTGRKFTRWRYTLYDKAGTVLSSSELLHGDVAVGETATSYIYLGPEKKNQVVRISVE